MNFNTTVLTYFFPILVLCILYTIFLTFLAKKSLTYDNMVKIFSPNIKNLNDSASK